MIDKSLYVAMTGASASLQAQAGVAQNLSNANTVGFQATLQNLRAVPILGDGHASRVATVAEDAGVSATPGVRISTGNPLDVALDQERWLAVQAKDGSTAYTRAGDLRLDGNGLLRTGAGLPVLNAQGAPLAIPPYDSLNIGDDGTISVVPQGQPASTLVQVDRLQVIEARQDQLARGDDGLMRSTAAEPPPAAAGKVLSSGALEQSNVDSTSMLVRMIELSRQFEMQVRVLHSGDENARSANSLLSSR